MASRKVTMGITDDSGANSVTTTMEVSWYDDGDEVTLCVGKQIYRIDKAQLQWLGYALSPIPDNPWHDPFIVTVNGV